MRPKFIAFEGIDGSGKSTQAKLLNAYLLEQQKEVLFTFEPTNNKIGSILRNILTGKETAAEEVIAGLFVADRLDHILNKEYGMKPALENGKWVICDRYYFSSYAYNGVQTDMEWVMQANAMSAKLCKPDVHFFIDVPPEVCMQRVLANRNQIDLYENIDNLIKVRNKFFEAFDLSRDQENIIIIDGNRDPQEVHAEVLERLKELEE